MHIFLGEGTGGLIEDEHAAADGQGAGDFDDLLGRGGESKDGAIQIERGMTQEGEGLEGAAFHVAAADKSAPGGLEPEDDIFGDGEMRALGESS